MISEYSNIQWGNKEAVVNGDENFIVDVTAIDDDSACIPKQIGKMSILYRIMFILLPLYILYGLIIMMSIIPLSHFA